MNLTEWDRQQYRDAAAAEPDPVTARWLAQIAELPDGADMIAMPDGARPGPVTGMWLAGIFFEMQDAWQDAEGTASFRCPPYPRAR